MNPNSNIAAATPEAKTLNVCGQESGQSSGTANHRLGKKNTATLARQRHHPAGVLTFGFGFVANPKPDLWAKGWIELGHSQ